MCRYLGHCLFSALLQRKIFTIGWVSAASVTSCGSGSRVPLTSLLALYVVFEVSNGAKTATKWFSVLLTRVSTVLCFKQSHFSFATEIQELWKLGEPDDEVGHLTLFLCD